MLPTKRPSASWAGRHARTRKPSSPARKAWCGWGFCAPLASPPHGGIMTLNTATRCAEGTYMKGTVFAVALAATLAFAMTRVAAAEAPSPGAEQLALATIPAHGAARLIGASPAFPAGGD